MKKRLVAGLALAGLLAVGSPPAQAQNRVFATAGLGAGSPGVAWNLSLHVSRGRWMSLVRASASEEFQILGPSPVESVRDVAVLLGFASSSEKSLSYVTLGVGTVRSVRRGKLLSEGFLFGPHHERIEESSIGIPFEIGALRRGSHAGFGVKLFGELSGAGGFVGVALTVGVGKLR